MLSHRGHPDTATRLMSAAQSQRTAMALSADEWWKRTQQRRMEQLRAAVGDEHFNSLAAAGGLLSFEQAIDAAREALAAPNPAASLARTPERGPS